MIKVLNVITSGMRREGITTTQFECIRNMNTDGIRMDLLAVHNNDPKVLKEFADLGCSVIVMPDRKKETLRYCMKLYRIIKKNDYDIIHVHGSSSLLSIELFIAKLCGVRVRIAHSRNTTCDHPREDSLLRPLFNISYTKALACGEDAGKWLFGEKDFTVIHNGKDLEKFKYCADIREIIRNKYNIGNKTAIATVGSMNRQKNHLFLLDIFNLIYQNNPDCMLFIMGEGDIRDEIELKIREYGLDEYVVLTGRVSNVNEILQGMDIMLLPSLHEGLPNVVLEWQASGLVSLVADTVTTECSVSSLVSFLPIDQGAQLWADAVSSVDLSYDREYASEYACKKLSENGFEIKENAEIMRRVYLDLM